VIGLSSLRDARRRGYRVSPRPLDGRAAFERTAAADFYHGRGRCLEQEHPLQQIYSMSKKKSAISVG
jgi:hypothetical protein